MSVSGGCQCGAVRYRVEGGLENPHLCHCRMCQKAAGNYFMPLAGAVRQKIVVTRGEPGWFHSSDIVRRGFCAKCGSTLVWQIKGGKHQSVSAQAFEDPSVFEFRSQIFFDEKPSNFDFANETRNMTGAEVMAMYAPKSEGAQ